MKYSQQIFKVSSFITIGDRFSLSLCPQSWCNSVNGQIVFITVTTFPLLKITITIFNLEVLTHFSVVKDVKCLFYEKKLTTTNVNYLTIKRFLSIPMILS